MKYISNIKVNRIIKYLIISDLIFWSGWGLISPIFAVFIVEKIQGGTVAVVGMATAIYWILRSLLRVPIGVFLDGRQGEEDNFWFLFFGLILTSLVPFGYLMASLSWHIYLLQTVYAIGMAMALSGWTIIFTCHIDKGKEATEWGLDGASVGLGIGIAGAIGGLMVARFGFNLVFTLVGILGILSALLLLPLLKEIPSSPRSAKKGEIFSIKESLQKEQR
jgi:sugar phosphate permease